ncbi:MAG: four helix bundle protein [Bacteroidota bacterium]
MLKIRFEWKVLKKIYDLEERTNEFAKSIRCFIRKLEINIWNREDIKQVVRSSSSVAANYIEDNEKLGDKDFLMKLRICKKEIKETILWLRLIDIHSEDLEIERTHLINEAIELKNIVGAIYKNNISKYN